MAVFKRGNVWWYEFIFAGRRVRESAKTSRKTLALEAEKGRRLQMERIAVGLPVNAATASQKIESVKAILEEYRVAYELGHTANAAVVVKERSPHLVKHLGSVLRADLTEKRLRDYMTVRLREGAGNRTVNMELEVLSRALGSTWRALWPKLPKLKEPREVGRALPQEEQHSILEAASNSRSRFIYPAIHLALSTAMRSDEILNLRWRDLSFERRELVVPKSKTNAGEGRLIPLNPNLHAVLSSYASFYLERFKELRPEWYIFPFSNRRKPLDPTRPTTTLKSAWNGVRTASGVRCRFHDLRHTAITMMAEAGIPEQTIRAIAGHVSQKMLERYSHPRVEAKRQAVMALQSPIAMQNSIVVPTKIPTVSGSRVVN